MQRIVVQQSQRAAEEESRLLAQGTVVVADLSERFALHGPSAGHLAEALHPLAFVILGLLQHLSRRDNAVRIGVGGVMGRLRTPLAVLRALSGPGIDDAAGIEGRLAKVACNLGRRLLEGLSVLRFGQAISLLIRQGFAM